MLVELARLTNIQQKKKFHPKQKKTVVAKVIIIPKLKTITVVVENVDIQNVLALQLVMVLQFHPNLF